MRCTSPKPECLLDRTQHIVLHGSALSAGRGKHAVFNVSEGADRLGDDLAHPRPRGGNARGDHHHLHRGRLRRRRYRRHQDQLALGVGLEPPTIFRCQGPQLHDRDREQRRGAAARGQSQQHPALGWHRTRARCQRLSAQGRHHHGAARRPLRRLARLSRAVGGRDRLPVQGVRRRLRHLRLR